MIVESFIAGSSELLPAELLFETSKASFITTELTSHSTCRLRAALTPTFAAVHQTHKIMRLAIVLVLLAGLTDRMAHAQADCSQSSSYKLNAVSHRRPAATALQGICCRHFGAWHVLTHQPNVTVLALQPGESASPGSITCYDVAGQPLATMSIEPADLQCVCPEGDYTSDCSTCPVVVETTTPAGRR